MNKFKVRIINKKVCLIGIYSQAFEDWLNNDFHPAFHRFFNKSKGYYEINLMSVKKLNDIQDLHKLQFDLSSVPMYMLKNFDWVKKRINLQNSEYKKQTPKTFIKKEDTSHWNTLYLTPGAPIEVIKASYRALSMINHPDKGGSEETMKKINIAYEELIKKSV